jgi:hypothetical protein
MKLHTRSEAAADFHELARSLCWDSLASSLLELHQPLMTGDRPGCQGCDQTPETTYDPIWPCRTFNLIVSTMLRRTRPNREFQLLTLLAATERQNTRSAVPPFNTR